MWILHHYLPFLEALVSVSLLTILDFFAKLPPCCLLGTHWWKFEFGLKGSSEKRKMEKNGLSVLYSVNC